MQLAPIEVTLLEAAPAGEPEPIAAIAARTDAPAVTLRGAAHRLADEGLCTVTTETTTTLAITDEGRRYLDEGLPEHRLATAAAALSAPSVPEAAAAAELADAELQIALANAARKQLASIDGGVVTAEAPDPDADPEVAALAAVADGDADAVDAAVRDRLLERSLVTADEATELHVALTDAGVTALMEGVEATDAVGQLTPELLQSGRWADVAFAPYNVTADPPARPTGRQHVLRATAERVKDVLIGMGFAEMTGPHADADFWINDCLFMPQDHPARTHWDRFALDLPPAETVPAGLLERVAAAHTGGVGADGEGYHTPFDPDVTRAMALRGHTTSLSMRYLSGAAVGPIEPPARYFSVEKVYRNDTLDATHLLEFFQIEGWVLADALSVRDLMGTFERFYAAFGITDVRFKPHYNPYTEPSFELFGRHPVTDELIEIGNSGLFRPEVLEPLGVEGDVMAWGLALERLAMLTSGTEDIRDLHGTLADLAVLRSAEVPY